MYSKKQIAWVIKYNKKYPVFKVDSTKGTFRWSNYILNMDVNAFNDAGLDIWDKRLRKAVRDSVLYDLAIKNLRDADRAIE